MLFNEVNFLNKIKTFKSNFKLVVYDLGTYKNLNSKLIINSNWIIKYLNYDNWIIKLIYIRI